MNLLSPGVEADEGGNRSSRCEGLSSNVGSVDRWEGEEEKERDGEDGFGVLKEHGEGWEGRVKECKGEEGKGEEVVVGMKRGRERVVVVFKGRDEKQNASSVATTFKLH